MSLVGFKRATIKIHGEDGKTIVIEGKENEGATSTAEITGLAPTPVRVAGSDITYYVSQRGTGEVSVNLGVIDIKNTDSDEILGYKKGQDGIVYIGRETEAPYASLLLESSDLTGDKALLGFFKGRFSKEAISLASLAPGTPYEPGAEAYVFSAIEDDQDGESNGNSVGKYVGKEDDVITALTNKVLRTTP